MLNSLVVSLIISKLSKYLLFFYFFGGKSFQQHPFIAASPKAESNLRNSGSSPSPSICPPLPPLFPVFTATLFPPRPPPRTLYFASFHSLRFPQFFQPIKWEREKKGKSCCIFFFLSFGKRHNAVHIFFRATFPPAGKKRRVLNFANVFAHNRSQYKSGAEKTLPSPPHFSLPHNIHIFISRKNPASQTSGKLAETGGGDIFWKSAKNQHLFAKKSKIHAEDCNIFARKEIFFFSFRFPEKHLIGPCGSKSEVFSHQNSKISASFPRPVI